MFRVLEQVFARGSLIDPGSYCAHNGFVGVLLIGAAFLFGFSGPPAQMGVTAAVLVAGCGVILLLGMIVPLLWPRAVPHLLALHGLLIALLTLSYVAACVRWAVIKPAEHSFRYLPGPALVGLTYGMVQWAEFGPLISTPRPWRVGGLVAGVAAELTIAATAAWGLLQR